MPVILQHELMRTDRGTTTVRIMPPPTPKKIKNPIKIVELLGGRGVSLARPCGSWLRRIGRPPLWPFDRGGRRPTGIPWRNKWFASSSITMDVGPAANDQGMTEDDVGGATALPGANITPARQLTRLYPLFNGRNAGSGLNASAGKGGTAQRVSSPPAAAAAVPVDAVQAGGRIEGVAVRALDTSRVGGTTGGVALRAPGPLPPRPVPGTAETAAASAANPGSAICTDSCAGGTCVDGCVPEFVPAAIIAATAPAVANPYTNTACGTAADTGGGGWRGRWCSGRTMRQNSCNGWCSGRGGQPPCQWQCARCVGALYAQYLHGGGAPIRPAPVGAHRR